MNATGAEINAFYEAWPMGKDWYHDDNMIDVDDQGKGLLEESVEYDVDDMIGILCWQGSGEVPHYIEINGVKVTCQHRGEGPMPSECFKVWRGDSRVHSVLLRPDQVERFNQIKKEEGWL